MKRKLSVILCILMLLGLFLLPASAEVQFSTNEKQTAVFSEDLSSFTTQSGTFIRHDTSMLSSEYWGEEGTQYKAQFTSERPEIQKITVERSLEGHEYWVEITYKDGSTLSCTYLRDYMIDHYDKLLTSDSANGEIDFGWPDGNQVSAPLSALMTEPATVSERDILEWCDYFEVYAYSDDRELQVSRGQLYSMEDGFYYMDYSENNITAPFIYPGDYNSLKVHLITDSKLVEALTEAENEYNGLGSLFGEAITRGLGIILLILFFGLIPTGLTAFGLILFLRSKKSAYKKLGLWLLIPSALTLLIFIALLLMIIL